MIVEEFGSYCFEKSHYALSYSGDQLLFFKKFSHSDILLCEIRFKDGKLIYYDLMGCTTNIYWNLERFEFGAFNGKYMTRFMRDYYMITEIREEKLVVKSYNNEMDLISYKELTPDGLTKKEIIYENKMIVSWKEFNQYEKLITDVKFVLGEPVSIISDSSREPIVIGNRYTCKIEDYKLTLMKKKETEYKELYDDGSDKKIYSILDDQLVLVTKLDPDGRILYEKKFVDGKEVVKP